ncbi:MAG: KH domain-containing protein [Acutalibacteraceae bacterium]
MKDLLKVIAQGLVENPDAVVVTQDEPAEDGTIVLHLHVAEDDMGRVIGKQGRIAKAMRTVMRAAATRQDLRVSVEID